MLDFLYVDKMLMYVEEVARVLDYQGQDQLICSQFGEDIYEVCCSCHYLFTLFDRFLHSDRYSPQYYIP
jgi:hypothetical protein